MRIDKKKEQLQNLIKRKITNSELATILNLGSGQAVLNRINRGTELKDFEILKLDEAFKEEINKINQNKPLKTSLKRDTSDCIALPVRGNVAASMGYGVDVYDESQTETYFVSLQFLKEIGANTDKTEVIFAKGDSMEPTIYGGDRLFVDMSKKEIYDGKVYCIRYEGNLYAKRLQKIPTSTIVVISDNPKYESWKIDFSKELEFDFEIIGEILYWGRVAR